MESKQQKVTPEYLKTNAVKADKQREGNHLNADIITDLLPQEYKITINRVFETNDATVLKWYYELAHHGKFGERLAHLIALDAYGRIPQTSTLSDFTVDEKIDQLVTTVAQITNMLIRNQKMTEHSMVSQAKSIKFLQNVASTVKSQGELLKAIEAVMISENKYTHDEITTTLSGIKKAMEDIAEYPAQTRTI